MNICMYVCTCYLGTLLFCSRSDTQTEREDEMEGLETEGGRKIMEGLERDGEMLMERRGERGRRKGRRNGGGGGGGRGAL